MVMFSCRQCCYKVFEDAMFGRIFTNICSCSLKLVESMYATSMQTLKSIAFWFSSTSSRSLPQFSCLFCFAYHTVAWGCDVNVAAFNERCHFVFSHSKGALSFFNIKIGMQINGMYGVQCACLLHIQTRQRLIRYDQSSAQATRISRKMLHCICGITIYTYENKFLMNVESARLFQRITIFLDDVMYIFYDLMNESECNVLFKMGTGRGHTWHMHIHNLNELHIIYRNWVYLK